MPEAASHSLDYPATRNEASAHGQEASAGERVTRNKPISAPSATRAAGRGKKSASTRQPADILAGLPAHVMDELVEDMAEAVVAVLLDQATLAPDDEDDASDDLRKV